MIKKKTRVKIEDPALMNGVFEGNLAYGRCENNRPKQGVDFPAERDEEGKPTNLPVNRLVLVRPRDPRVWSKDKKIKKPTADNTTHFQNYVLRAYLKQIKLNKSNFHLKIDKSKL